MVKATSGDGLVGKIDTRPPLVRGHINASMCKAYGKSGCAALAAHVWQKWCPASVRTWAGFHNRSTVSHIFFIAGKYCLSGSLRLIGPKAEVMGRHG